MATPLQVPEVDVIAAGSYKQLEPPEIKAKGYVVRSLEAVLWAFYHTQSFKDGCLKVGKLLTLFTTPSDILLPPPVNLGDDADTVGAIYGQLAGAYYGVEAIPDGWKSRCSLSPLIELFATELLCLADSMPEPDMHTHSSTDWSATQTPLALDKCKCAKQR